MQCCVMRDAGMMLFSRTFRFCALLVAIAVVPSICVAHPGTGIVVDGQGNVYFVDMVNGVWRVDASGRLTHLPGPAFHWLAFDEQQKLRGVTLPSGASGDIVRLASVPSLLLSSDVPIATSADGSLYYPTRGGAPGLQILHLSPSGNRSTFTTLPARSDRPAYNLNEIAVRDGFVYYTEDDAVRRVDSDGRIATIAEHVALKDCRPVTGIGRESLPLLRGLAVDSIGSVYVAATGCARLLKISTRGAVTAVYQAEGDWSPTGVAISGTTVYVLEFIGAGSDDRPSMIPRIRRIAADGSSSVLATVRR